MIVDRQRARTIRGARAIQRPQKLFFLAVHAQNRQTTRAKIAHQSGDLLELLVALFFFCGGELFARQTLAHLALSQARKGRQLPHEVTADQNALCGQSLLDVTGFEARPTHLLAHGTARDMQTDDLVKLRLQFGVLGDFFFRPPPSRRTRELGARVPCSSSASCFCPARTVWGCRFSSSATSATP